MKVDIVTDPLNLDLYGFGDVAPERKCVEIMFSLSDKVWSTVKLNDVKNKGKNIWIYGPGDDVFAGLELESSQTENTGLQHKSLTLAKYAYYKHIGPYSFLRHAGDTLKRELRAMNYFPNAPYIEIYGHWTSDETKLETELLVAIH